MGIHLNPGNEAFVEALNSDYVDKTGLIDVVNATINKSTKLTCVSRPRWFGKTTAASMLVAYYDCNCDSHELFNGYQISECASYEENLNKYNVIAIDVTGFISMVKSGTSINKEISKVPTMIGDAIKRDIFDVYIDINKTSDLLECLDEYVDRSGRKFVFVIDEWDALFREAKYDYESQEKYLNLLRDLFMKNEFTSRVVAACFMTGILPIKNNGIQSVLSDFKEYSAIKSGRSARFFGFAGEEVKELCKQFGMDYFEVKKWYDGYEFGVENHMYNPYSVMNAMYDEKCYPFWKMTCAPDVLDYYVDMDFDGLQTSVIRLISGEEIKVNTEGFHNDFVSFQDRDDVLTLLIHLGYLTYNEETGCVRIPNGEVYSDYTGLLKRAVNNKLNEYIKISQKLLDDTLAGYAEAVVTAIERIRESNYASNYYNNEQTLIYVIKFAYIVCVDKYLKVEELPSGKGVADVVFIPKKTNMNPAMVVELKWNKSSEAAIAQIKDKNYPAVLKDYDGEVVLVGINYDEKTKSHSCVIERVEK